MIVSCEFCAKKYKLPESAAGKKIKCPGCGEAISVPQSGLSGSQKPGRKSTGLSGGTGSKQPRRSSSSKASEGQSAAGKRAAASRRGSGTARRKNASKQRGRARQDDDLIADYDDFAADDDFADDDFGGGDFGDDPYAAPSGRGRGSSRKKGRRGKSGLKTVGLGLLIQAFGMSAVIGMTLIGVVLGFTGNVAIVTVALYGLLGVAVLGAVAMLVGELLCLSAPADSGGKGLIIGAVVCHLIGWGIAAMNLISPPANPNMVLAAVSAISSLAYFVLWLLFLRKIADYAGQKELRGRVTTVLIGIPVCWLVMILSIVLGITLVAAPGIFRILLSLVILADGVAAIVIFAIYLVLLFRLGSALRK